MPQTIQGPLSRPQRREGEVEPVAIPNGEAEVSEGQGVKPSLHQVIEDKNVARRFGHLHPVGQQVLPVDPVAYVGLAESGFTLGDLVLMMGEDIVYAPGVDIQLLSHVLGGHGRALDVPPREPLAPRAIPLHVAAGFRHLPQGKVASIALERIDLSSNPLHQALLKVT